MPYRKKNTKSKFFFVLQLITFRETEINLRIGIVILCNAARSQTKKQAKSIVGSVFFCYLYYTKPQTSTSVEPLEW